METFNPILLPDLDTAEIIEARDMRYKQFAHIEYFKTTDGTYMRVCKPFGEYPVFYVPITSLEAEYLNDLEIIRKHLQTYFPGYQETTDPDDIRDNDWMNENCFSRVIQEQV